MILTDDEIYTMYSEPCSDAEMIEFARAIEAAILAKIGEPVAWTDGTGFTSLCKTELYTIPLYKLPEVTK